VATGEDEEEDDDEEEDGFFFSGFASPLLTSSCSAFSSGFFDPFKVFVSNRAPSVFVLCVESLPGETMPLSAAARDDVTDVKGLAPRLRSVFFETVTDVPMGALSAFLDGSRKRRVCIMEIDVMQVHTVVHIANSWYGESKRFKGNKARKEKIITMRMQIAIATRSFVIRTIVFLDFCCFTLSALDWRKN